MQQLKLPFTDPSIFKNKKTHVNLNGKPRQLKIQETINYISKAVFPQIRLQGKWLLNAGFKAGDTVYIYVKMERFKSITRLRVKA